MHTTRTVVKLSFNIGFSKSNQLIKRKLNPKKVEPWKEAKNRRPEQRFWKLNYFISKRPFRIYINTIQETLVSDQKIFGYLLISS